MWVAGSASKRSASVKRSALIPGILDSTGGKSAAGTPTGAAGASGSRLINLGAVALLREGGVDSTTA